MAMAGMALSVLAGIGMLVFGIQILITAFKTSVGWGLASLLLPFAVFVFIAKHWQATKTPFLRSLIAFAIGVVGSALSIFGAVSGAAPQ
jgi:F0F1-type ATP synthase assembly protein I